MVHAELGGGLVAGRVVHRQRVRDLQHQRRRRGRLGVARDPGVLQTRAHARPVPARVSCTVAPRVNTRYSLGVPAQALLDELLGLVRHSLEQLGGEVERGGGDVAQGLLVRLAWERRMVRTRSSMRKYLPPKGENPVRRT